MPDFIAPKTWNVDEVLTAVDLNVQLRDNMNHLQEWLGEIAYNQVVADVSGITTETTIVTLNATIPEGGRNIMLVAQLQLEVATSVTTPVEVRIKEGAAVLEYARFRPVALTTPETMMFTKRLVAPAAGAHTYTLTVVRVSGTGTITVRAGNDRVAFLQAVGV